MNLSRMLLVSATLALIPAAMAQQWEFGGGLGASFYTSHDVTNGSASASASIAPGPAGSVWLDENAKGRWGGEVRYDYQRGDLKIEQAGTSARFGAETHALHYDFLWHAAPSESKIRPYLSAGGGVKIYHGTGQEVVAQPLSQYALLTHGKELKPMLSLGAGLKVQVSSALQVRLEVHDYLTTFPQAIIAPNVGSHIDGWMQNIVPMIGLSYLF